MKVVQLDLIELCKQNNRKAQLKLYNQYCDGMYSIAKRFVNHTAEAEDVVQESFIKAFSKLQFNNKTVSNKKIDNFPNSTSSNNTIVINAKYSNVIAE